MSARRFCCSSCRWAVWERSRTSPGASPSCSGAMAATSPVPRSTPTAARTSTDMSASTRMSADAPALIAADWGTTSCRFALIGAGGTVLERATGRGILPVLADAAAGSDGPAASAAERAAVFEAELRAQAGEWLAQTPGIPVLMCGMIGSNTGWVDAGYREVPCEVVVDPADLTPVPLPGHPAWIVPGLLLPGRAPDIMRGEETQALGALLDAGDGADHLVIAPGTHSKWVRLRAGRVTGFRSYLTGDLFAALPGPAATPGRRRAGAGRASRERPGRSRPTSGRVSAAPSPRGSTTPTALRAPPVGRTPAPSRQPPRPRARHRRAPGRASCLARACCTASSRLAPAWWPVTWIRPPCPPI